MKHKPMTYFLRKYKDKISSSKKIRMEKENEGEVLHRVKYVALAA